jgi:hypothetical protein
MIFSVDQRGGAIRSECVYPVLSADDTAVGYFQEPWLYGRYHKPVGFVRRCKRRFTTVARGDYEVTDSATNARLALLRSAGTSAPEIEFLAAVDPALRELTVAAAYGLWRRNDERPRSG